MLSSFDLWKFNNHLETMKGQVIGWPNGNTEYTQVLDSHVVLLK